MSNVLFVCLHNAGRSQMSEAFFNEAVPNAQHEARSAGTNPAGEMHEVVVRAMLEEGIDLTGRRPAMLTIELAEWADLVVTMGCGDQCPYVAGVRYIDWQLEDPVGQSIASVRRTRQAIRQRVTALISELDRDT